MTAQEYIQMRAFARVDGLKMSLLWVASFACYVGGVRRPELGMVALVLTLLIPFYAGRLLRSYRDVGLDGIVSFGRGWGYVVFQFFYASLLFAAVQFLYLNYVDRGFFQSMIADMMSDPQQVAMLRQMGMADAMTETAQALAAMRPIDLALNIMTSNLMAGCLLGLPIAALCQRRVSVK